MGRVLNADGRLSEAAFQRQVEGLALFYGWRFFHAPDNRPVRTGKGKVIKQRTRAGFPDLVLVRGVELLFCELKTDRGRVSADQQAWLDDLRAVAVAFEAVVAQLRAVDQPLEQPAPTLEAHVWRPADFDELHARLARGRRQVPVSYDPRR